jgi:hypothetical protein
MPALKNRSVNLNFIFSVRRVLDALPSTLIFFRLQEPQKIRERFLAGRIAWEPHYEARSLPQLYGSAVEKLRRLSDRLLIVIAFDYGRRCGDVTLSGGEVDAIVWQGGLCRGNVNSYHIPQMPSVRYPTHTHPELRFFSERRLPDLDRLAPQVSAVQFQIGRRRRAMLPSRCAAAAGGRTGRGRAHHSTLAPRR